MMNDFDSVAVTIIICVIVLAVFGAGLTFLGILLNRDSDAFWNSIAREIEKDQEGRRHDHP